MTYYDWCTCIGAYLFNPGRAGREVSIDLDRDELIAASKAYLTTRKEEVPEESLRWASFLLALRDGPVGCGSSSDTIVFRAAKACQLWQRDLGQRTAAGIDTTGIFPLHLPYLVALVLPYSNSASDQEISTNSYYQRVSSWLNENGLHEGPFSTNAIINSLQRGMPSWPDLWDSVAIWSVEHEKGQRGVFRARRHGELRYVSLPLGQCLFPPRLRRSLRQYFSEQSDADQRTCYSRERVLALLREASNLGLPFPAPTSQCLWSPHSELCEIIISRTEEMLNIPVRVAPAVAESSFCAIRERTEPLTLFLSENIPTGVVTWYFRFSSTRQPLPQSLTLLTAAGEIELESQSRVWSGRVTGQPWPAVEIRVPMLDCTYRQELSDVYLFVAATSCFGLPDWVETTEWQSKGSLRLLVKASRQEELIAWGSTQAKDLKKLQRQGLPSGYVLFSLSTLASPPPGISFSRVRPSAARDPDIVVEGGLSLGAGRYLYTSVSSLLPNFRLSPQAVLSGRVPYVRYYDDECADLRPSAEDAALWILPDFVSTDRRLRVCIGDTGNTRLITLKTPSLPSHVSAELYRSNAYDEPVDGNAASWVAGAYVEGLQQHIYDNRKAGASDERTRLSLVLNILYESRTTQRTPHENAVDQTNTPSLDPLCDDSDLLLYYLSHAQRTSSIRFKAAFNSIASAAGLHVPSQEDYGQCLLLLAQLGHVIRQADGTALALPPTLVRLPAGPGERRALLVGSRSPELLRQLREATLRQSANISRIPQPASTLRCLLPDTIIVEIKVRSKPASTGRTVLRSLDGLAAVAASKTGPDDQLRQIANECGILYRNEPASLPLALFGGHGLADYERRLATMSEDYGIYEGFLQRRFNSKLIRWESSPTGSPLEEGLFFLRHNSPIRGRFDVRYILIHAGRQIRVNPSWARYLILKQAGKQAWHYCAQTSQLAVPASAPLPSLPARALTILSGRAPELRLLSREGQPRYYHIYRAVPATLLKYYLEPALSQRAHFDSQIFLS